MNYTEELDHDILSIGGAMGSWPLKTPRWTCRNERTQETDPAVIDALLGRDTVALLELIERAEALDVDTSNLRRKRDKLNHIDVRVLTERLNQHYKSEYPDGLNCPFEETGLNRACQRCPVASKALGSIDL